MLGIGLRESQMNEQASTYFDNALKIASTIPDTEYPFFTKEALLENLIDAKKPDAARSWPMRFWHRRSSGTILRPRPLC